MGTLDSLMDVKKLILAMIVRCQNSQCFAAYYIWGCAAADRLECPCWPPSTTESVYNEYVMCQNWTIEQWEKVSWSDESRIVLDYVNNQVRARCLPGGHGTKMHCGRSQAGRGSLTLWAMFRWKTLGSGIHMEALVCTIYLTLFADQIQPFIAAIFPDGSSPFQKDNAPCSNCSGTVWGTRKKEMKVLTWPPNSQNQFNQASVACAR